MPSALFVTTVPITLEAFLLPFADHFRTQGWRVDALSNGATRQSALEGHFDERFDIGWSRDPFSPRNLLGTAARVREIVSAGGYDVVHVHTPIASFITRFALRELHGQPGSPTVIYTAHGFHFYEGQNPLSHALYRAAERAGAQWTDYLVTINQQDFAAAQSLGTIAPDRVRYIPGIGVDTERFAPATVPAEETATIRADLGLAENDFVVLMIAELSRVKRHDLVLDAMKRVTDPRVRLVVVGGGPLEGHYREWSFSLGLTDRVKFAGYRRDIPALLAASDVVLLTSEREGLNRSILEALASGVPVIGTDTRGITDAVGPDAGWIVGHSDAAGVAAAIEAAAANPEEIARRGAAGRERVCREFALERIVDAYDGLYHEALSHRV